MTSDQRTVPLDGAGPVHVTFTDYGEGRPYLLLHGGGGPDTVTPFAELLADSRHVRVICPVHPGFGGTARPDGLATVGGLAALYDGLLEQLGLTGVTVMGSSIGGWITAELALRASTRVGGIVLIDAVGIEVPGHPIADFFALTMEQVFQLSYYDPAPFRFDPAALPPAVQAIVAGNRAALATYSGPSMSDPGLAGRLAGVRIPARVLWGDSDRIADPDYGRAFAAAIPGAEFVLLPRTGHLPQLETPEQTLDALGA